MRADSYRQRRTRRTIGARVAFDGKPMSYDKQIKTLFSARARASGRRRRRLCSACG